VAFFFSSRRRHTRSKRDWSSDVCSSDLTIRSNGTIFENDQQTAQMNIAYSNNPNTLIKVDTGIFQAPDNQALQEVPDGATFSLRSEERRVGKEGRSRRAQERSKKTGEKT